MEVGVRELKKYLSKYLDRAARGEVIQVTDRGQPKAVLGPVPGRVDLAAAATEGWLALGEERAVAHVRRGRSSKRIADVLDEDRSGRASTSTPSPS